MERATPTVAAGSLAFLFALFAGGAWPAAADWPGILGAERSGRTAGSLPSAFPPKGPEVLWRVGVGEGMAGAVVA
ncbi:MAG: alcohol dehydrogenase, partial [Acidobacteriota bacterium]